MEVVKLPKAMNSLKASTFTMKSNKSTKESERGKEPMILSEFKF